VGANSRFTLQACLSFAMFVGLRGLLPCGTKASSLRKHNAKSFAGLFVRRGEQSRARDHIRVHEITSSPHKPVKAKSEN